MASCLGCGSRPHLQNCPEDMSLSRQRRWQLRKKKGGCCVTCGKKAMRKSRSALGKVTLTQCSECSKFRIKKASGKASAESAAA